MKMTTLSGSISLICVIFCGLFAASVSAEKVSPDTMNKLWYGGKNKGADIKGVFNKNICQGGIPGVSNPRFALNSTGEDLLLAISGLRNKPTSPTEVLLLDVETLMKANNATWPSQMSKLKTIIQKNPSAILLKLNTRPPEFIRVSGVPKGKKLIALSCAEVISADKRDIGAHSQVLTANVSQIGDGLKSEIPAKPVQLKQNAVKSLIQKKSVSTVAPDIKK